MGLIEKVKLTLKVTVKTTIRGHPRLQYELEVDSSDNGKKPLALRRGPSSFYVLHFP